MCCQCSGLGGKQVEITPNAEGRVEIQFDAVGIYASPLSVTRVLDKLSYPFLMQKNCFYRLFIILETYMCMEFNIQKGK